jgi:hypothetical protein
MHDDDPQRLKERDMNTERTTQAIASILKHVDFADLADGILSRVNLQRRRPATTALSALGWIGLGAAGAFAVVAFVPAVREALTEDPVGRLREAVDDVIGDAEEAALDAERAVKRKMTEAKDSAKNALKSQARPSNGNKLDV